MDRQDNNKLLLTEELLLSVSVWNLFYLFFPTWNSDYAQANNGLAHQMNRIKNYLLTKYWRLHADEASAAVAAERIMKIQFFFFSGIPNREKKKLSWHNARLSSADIDRTLKLKRQPRVFTRIMIERKERAEKKVKLVYHTHSRRLTSEMKWKSKFPRARNY